MHDTYEYLCGIVLYWVVLEDTLKPEGIVVMVDD